ncbi:MAG: DUF3263 domain-containing protein, partial [Nocardioides sp.]
MMESERHPCHSPPGGSMDTAAGLAVAPEADGAQGELTEREREILAFERQWWKYAGAKEQAVKDLFDL